MNGVLTRRQWLALGGFALATSCARRRAHGYPGYALVATSGENSLAVIDLLSFQLSKAVALGASPTAVVSAPNGNRSYALTPASGSVHLLDGNCDLRVSRRLADGLAAIQATPDGQQVLGIAAAGKGELIAADARTLGVSRRQALSALPVDLDVSTTGYAAVSTGQAGRVELVHLPSGQRTETQLSGEIGAVRFRSDGRMLLVANYHGRSLTALDVPTLQTIAELPLAMVPQNLCFTPDGGQLFITGPEMDGVAIVFPYQILEVDQTVLAGRTPGVMACSETPPYLFVASRDVSTVSVLNVQTRNVIGVAEVGQKPDFVALTPDGQYALVLNERSGDVAVVYVPAIRKHKLTPDTVLSTLVAPLFTMVSVGSRPVGAAIMPRPV